jgi:diamine N-acetyltransferase
VRDNSPQVELREISRDNLWAVCRLRVAEDQRGFVADNIESIAEAYVEPCFRPFAIYAPGAVGAGGAGGEPGTDDGPVGFTMYGYEDDRGRWWIIRLMIDESHQGRGYGRAAMQQLVGLMQRHEGCDAIVTSFVPGNHVAERLYERLGFRRTGESDEDEIVTQLNLSPEHARQ